MDLKTAQEIAEFRCAPVTSGAPRAMEAIKLLRGETAMNLTNAKIYLEQWSDYGKNQECLFQRLCEDFVTSKRDLLRQAKAELDRQRKYVQQLEEEIISEEGEELNQQAKQLKDEGKTEVEIAKELDLTVSGLRTMRYRQKAGEVLLTRKNYILLSNLEDVQNVVNAMNEIIDRHGEATVGDLYELVGLPSTYMDTKHGWTESPIGYHFDQVSEGYLVKFDPPSNLRGFRDVQA